MPSPFRRRVRLSPDFIAVPAEQTVVPDEVRIADLDRRLAAVSEALRTVRVEGLLARADGLLDQRNAIRPGKPRPVPVVPAASTRSSTTTGRTHGERPDRDLARRDERLRQVR
jgi:hypothetical protein